MDHVFVSARTEGLEPVVAALRNVPIAAYAARGGIAEAEVRRTARLIRRAKAFSSFEDLGVQMNHSSTLVSYLHKLLVFLTGSFGKVGTQYVPTTFVNFVTGASSKKSPVAGAPIISGLVPCSVITEEILTDHPKRYRAMLELLARLSALLPPPRYPLTRYHGVLAPRSAWRREIVPRAPASSAELTAVTSGSAAPAIAASPTIAPDRGELPDVVLLTPNTLGARPLPGARPHRARRSRVRR